MPDLYAFQRRQEGEAEEEGATRTVRLSDRAFKIVAGFADQWPEGPLFRNTSRQ